MGIRGALLVLIVAGGASFLYTKMKSVPPLPELEDIWWGEGDPKTESDIISPYKIGVPMEVLEVLKRRLDSAVKTFVSPLEGVNFEYGFNTDTLRKVVHFWRNNYDWREREKYLNSVPQFTTKISGLRMHFIHVKPNLNAKDAKSIRVIPLLMLHGWPGSVREMYDIIPLLTEPRKGYDYVFEVVVPSLPGYGFSEGAHRPGLTTTQIGLIMKKLMHRIGFSKFYVQGGDWGALIAADMATYFPESVLGVHSNMCGAMKPFNILKLIIGSFTWPTIFADESSVSHLYPLSQTFSFLMRESGYMHIQATKPDTVGIALRDSPVGLAAYILEKFSTWTQPKWINEVDGGFNLSDKPVKKEDGGHIMPLTALLDNVMLYYVTSSITTSMRIYSENFAAKHLSENIASIPAESVPASCARLPSELFFAPAFAIRDKFPRVVRISDLPRGGHFAVMEEPELMADDIWEGVKLMELEHAKEKSKENSKKK